LGSFPAGDRDRVNAWALALGRTTRRIIAELGKELEAPAPRGVRARKERSRRTLSRFESAHSRTGGNHATPSQLRRRLCSCRAVRRLPWRARAPRGAADVDARERPRDP